MTKLKGRSIYLFGIAFALTALLVLTFAPRLETAETPVERLTLFILFCHIKLSSISSSPA